MKIAMGRALEHEITAWLHENKYTNILAVADTNTAHFAKKYAPKARLYVYDTPLVPDEAAIGKLLLAAHPDDHALIAVGSGTINDITRYVSARLGLPYYVVGTAASMDGYTSTVAPLIVSGVKLTFSGQAPLGMVADADIYAAAPTIMTAAGFGDVLGKFTSTTDWELESDYNPSLGTEMRAIAQKCLDTCQDTNKAESVMTALIQSGSVMERAGHSKPASGSEHHLSHFWEMKSLLRGEIPALHGAKVGVGTLMVLQAQKWLAAESIDWEAAELLAQNFDIDAWRAEIARAYGPVAQNVCALWPEESAQTRLALVHEIRAQWPYMQMLMARNQDLRPAVEAALIRLCGPVLPRDIHVSEAEVIDGINHAFRVRRRFTTWRILDICGLLPLYAQRLAIEFNPPRANP